ncbi:MAG: FMN-binding protein [Sedimentibacter sp.]
MKKLLSVALCVMMLLSIAACANNTQAPPAVEPETLTGVGKGFGGEVKVTVIKEGDKITNVVAEGPNETNGIGSKAIAELPSKIVEANSTEVDVIAGATYTSKAIIYAVNNALDPAKYPAPVEEVKEEVKPEDVTAAEVYQGFGLVSTGRLGPGKDNTETPVYSINDVFAHTLFDQDGKILSLSVDILEVATPNYDGDGMPHFSGFPGQGGYNNDENHDEVVDGKTADTQENFLAEVEGWATKRERGDKYHMNTGTWTNQMDKYEQLFVGMTVEEVEQWFEKYTSDLNGRPLKDGSDKPEDKAKYDALSAEDKAMLADVTSTATMSLNDAHGNIVAAIKESFEKRVPLTDVAEVASQGTVVFNVPRVGPGKDDKDVQVYSLNKVFANALFDKDGKIVALLMDVLEVATPNYDGASMPHFTGFPGQSYNNDENHDEKVDGTITATEDNFVAEVAAWETKLDRGEDYKMGTGTWADQIEKYEEIFTGMTVEEVQEWFAKYTSDLNGRPLKDGSDKPEDKAKYDALTADEKAMLADVTSTATMSLKDGHGDLVGAIAKAYELRKEISLTVK